MVVNPATKEVIAVAHDECKKHPLRHAAFVCIEQIARIDLQSFPIDARTHEKRKGVDDGT